MVEYLLLLIDDLTMNLLDQKISLKKFLLLILVTPLVTLPFFWTIQSLVQFSYQPKNIEFFFKLCSGFAVVFFFPRRYWIKIPAVIFLLVPIYSLLIIGSDQLKAIEYFTSAKYSKQEIAIQIVLDLVLIGLFFVLNYFEKIKWGESLIRWKSQK